jgi:hypothetical protein
MAGAGVAVGSFARPYGSPPVLSNSQRVEKAQADLAEANAARAGQPPASQMYSDPASGNTYQWVGNSPSGNEGWKLFSQAQPTPRSGGIGSNEGVNNQGGPIDFASAWAKTAAMTPPAPPPLPAQVPGVSQEDRTAAEAAEFSKAKDIVGRTGRQSLNALSSEMRNRGIAGSGIHANLIGGAIDKASGQLGNVGLTNAIEALKRQAQIADENYQGAMGQRGQDIGYTANMANRDIATMNERGQTTRTLLELMQRNGGRLY